METAEYKKMDSIETGHFWFMAKRKFLGIALKKYSGSGNLKILDIGCGTGAIMDYLRSLGHDVSGVDMSEEALKYCREKGLSVRLGLADKVDFPDGYFDAVLSLDVLEHLNDDQTAVNEARRLLKQGGFFIATVPAHRFLWSYHDIALHHKRRYGRKEFSSLFDRGWELKMLTWIHAAIFLPVLILRKIGNSLKQRKNTSDVKQTSAIINAMMNFIYGFEVGFFRIFGCLPFGVSMMAVAKKK